MTRRTSPLFHAIVIAAAAQAAVAVLVTLFGSEGPVPMHFSLTGEVDRWGDRREAASAIGLMAAVSLGAGGLVAWNARSADDARRRGLALAIGVTLATTFAMTGLIAWMAGAGAAVATESPRVMLTVLCLLLASIGAVLGKVPRNPFVGVRTPWSLSSRLAWERSNRLGGRLFFWGGLTGALVAPLLPVKTGYAALVIAILIASGLCIFESWRVWRADPERRTV